MTLSSHDRSRRQRALSGTIGRYDRFGQLVERAPCGFSWARDFCKRTYLYWRGRDAKFAEIAPNLTPQRVRTVSSSLIHLHRICRTLVCLCSRVLSYVVAMYWYKFNWLLISVCTWAILLTTSNTRSLRFLLESLVAHPTFRRYLIAV